MALRILFAPAALWAVAISAHAQDSSDPDRQRYWENTVAPWVNGMLRHFDEDDDGRLTKDEVPQLQFGRSFKEWDKDENGIVTTEELAAYRRAPGTSSGQDINIRNPGSRRPLTQGAADVRIPEISELPRLDSRGRPGRLASRNSNYVLHTRRHKVEGDRYVILTDHDDNEWLKPLQRLAVHRDGIIISVDDLAMLYRNTDAMQDVHSQLRAARVLYLAVAPKMKSFRENMVLGMWELVSTLDSDPQVDVLPGFMVASSAPEFAALVDRSIGYQPQSPERIRPFAISHVPSVRELRSLEKSGIIRKLFNRYGCETPTVAVCGEQATGTPALPGDRFWSHQLTKQGEFLTEIPHSAKAAFDQASLLVMHGQGAPGMSCGVDVDAIPPELSPQIVLCGSAFSAAPRQSDLPTMRTTSAGHHIETRDAFVVRAVDRGATVVFGHMRMSKGFPHLFPVLESWLQGQSVGRAYQQLINSLIDVQRIQPGGFVVTQPPPAGRQPRQNILLYVVIGDPALQPFERLTH